MKILYRGFLYESYTDNDILRVYGSLIREWLSEQLHTDDQKVIEVRLKEIMNLVNDADPSNGKKWLGSIVEWMFDKRIEDISAQIKPDLIRFKKLLDTNPGKFGNVAKQIAKGKISYNKFKEVLSAYSDINTNEESKISDKVGDFPKVAEDNRFVMYVVNKWLGSNDSDKHFCFQGDVDWCVKYKQYFDDYQPPYYYILSKDTGKEYALMHLGSMQLKNIRDNALSFDEFAPIADIVLPIVENSDCGISGDFEVIGDYVTRVNLIEKYPRIYSIVRANGLLKALKLGQYDVVLNMLKLDNFNFNKVSWKIMHILIGRTSEGVLKKIIDKIFENKTLDVNELIYGKPPLVLAAKNRNKEIINKIMTNPNFDINAKDNDGRNLIIALYNYLNSTDLYAVGGVINTLLKDPRLKLSEDDKEEVLGPTITYGLSEIFKTILARGDFELIDEDEEGQIFDRLINNMEISRISRNSFEMFSDLINSNKVSLNAKNYLDETPIETLYKSITRLPDTEENRTVSSHFLNQAFMLLYDNKETIKNSNIDELANEIKNK